MTQIVAYICVSPRGAAIRSTIRHDRDASWLVLREAVSEPDTLIARGWTVERLSCVMVDASAAGLIQKLQAVPVRWSADDLLRLGRDREA